MPKRIAVAGDVTVDWFSYPVDAMDEEIGENWRRYPARHFYPIEGGALLLARFLGETLRAASISAKILTHRLPQGLRTLTPNKLIHSTLNLDWCRSRNGNVLRVQESLGYMGPAPGDPSPPPPPIDRHAAKAGTIILDDAGNTFRNLAGRQRKHRWPGDPLEWKRKTIILKVSRPLATGTLWRKIMDADIKGLVVVVDACDLRRITGTRIRRALSWEKTAMDLLFEMRRCADCMAMQQCPYLVIRFGLEGAILYRGGEDPSARLFFSRSLLENSLASSTSGGMSGCGSLFTATLAAEVFMHGLRNLENGIVRGMLAAQRLLSKGFIRQPHGVEYPWEDVTKTASDKELRDIGRADLDCSPKFNDSDPTFWRILDQATMEVPHIVAEQLVEQGESEPLRNVPEVNFGELSRIDRAEIEHLSMIREVGAEYLANPNPDYPLCFAAYGSPGSGKSFAVRQVLKSISDTDFDKRFLEFNVSQFRGADDLVAAFHKVRDVGLSGQTPLVFFDEFDCALEGSTYFWLRLFLAPMQDGQFRDGETTFNIGKAIFAFAGGTCSTFEEFIKKAPRQKKGPDFASRLRGFINVMGPNRQQSKRDADDTFLIRRAKMLRILLRKEPTASGLFNTKRELQIDKCVLRAFLHCSLYRHGNRSISAIIEMSRLAGKDRYSLSCLPDAEQLGMHVDADEFMWLADRERFVTILRQHEWPDKAKDDMRKAEELFVGEFAPAIHACYCQRRKEEGQDPGPESFDDLPEDLKNSNLDAAADIPGKLRKAGLGIRLMKRRLKPYEPTDQRLKHLLAVIEHERFMRERFQQGWKYGRRKNKDKRLSPYLVPFDELPPDIQAYDYQAIEDVFKILAEKRYKVFPLPMKA